MRIDKKLLAHAMIDREMSVNKLAELSGVSRGTISNIRCGKTCVDHVGNKIAKALGIDVTEIIEKDS